MESDIDVVRAVLEAFTERDVEGVLAYSDEAIEFSAVTGDHAGHTEPYRGHAGIRQYFRDVAAVWDELVWAGVLEQPARTRARQAATPRTANGRMQARRAWP